MIQNKKNTMILYPKALWMNTLGLDHNHFRELCLSIIIELFLP